MRVDAPAISHSGTRPRSPHTFPIPSPIAHLQVRTGVHAHSPVASGGAKNQVNWNSFPLPQILGERREARRTNALRLAEMRRWTGQQSTKSSTSWFISARNAAARRSFTLTGQRCSQRPMQKPPHSPSAVQRTAAHLKLYLVGERATLLRFLGAVLPGPST
jgi:hypothetical protein